VTRSNLYRTNPPFSHAIIKRNTCILLSIKIITQRVVSPIESHRIGTQSSCPRDTVPMLVILSMLVIFSTNTSDDPSAHMGLSICTSPSSFMRSSSSLSVHEHQAVSVSTNIKQSQCPRTYPNSPYPTLP
jgi:hypothetical protein